jgi:Thioredoxin
VDPTALAGAGVAAGVLAAASAVGAWLRRSSGRVRPAAASAGTPNEPAMLPDGLGRDPDAAATLVLFSSAFCAPCRVTRRVCAEVAGLLDGVHHVEVDAESHLDAVRALGIWRTPTVLVVDAAGRVVQRGTGVPTRAQVIAAVAPLLPAATR